MDNMPCHITDEVVYEYEEEYFEEMGDENESNGEEE